MKKNITASALLFLACQLNASAANWLLVDGAPGITAEIDVDSISPNGAGVKKAWVRYSYSENQKSAGYPIFQYMSMLQLKIYSCSERSTDVLQEVFYSEADGKGSVVQSNAYPRSKIDLVEVVPGSIGEGILNFVCSWAKPKKK